jgi:UDPglucose--hexose-1-phosphate uridylyltransferase
MNDREIREIRINPVVPAESVLIATARSMRPKKAEEQAPRDTRKHVETCPFCTGNESRTPPAIAVYPASGDWRVRVVENLYPVLGDDHSHPNISFGLQQIIDGYGRHEVIIDHADHGAALHEMSVAHLCILFGAYRDRMRDLFAADARLKYVLVFFHKHHQCIFCSLIDEALTFEATIYDRESGQVRRKINVGQYVVERGRKFIAVKPFASRYEWEVHILPLAHQADFQAIASDDLEDLARVVQRTMARLEAVLGGVQYNFFLHSLPHDARAENAASYHWHLEIAPRTSIPTGFELGSGLFVNTVSPEFAAEKLRGVILD